jgi:ribosomal protein L11 methyltransferase
MSFLEMLDVLNERLIKKGERPVAFDHDCREGICGTCSLMINGRPHGPQQGHTTCQLHMRSFKDGDEITIEPWRAKAFPVIKDLVVDRGAFDRIIAGRRLHLGQHRLGPRRQRDPGAKETPTRRWTPPPASAAAPAWPPAPTPPRCCSSAPRWPTSAKLPQGQSSATAACSTWSSRWTTRASAPAPTTASARRPAPRRSRSTRSSCSTASTWDIRTDDDWRDSWKRFYSPMIFGDGALLLRPSWIPRRPGDPERELVLDPGRAFGTGQHESTRLCMELLVEISARGGVASSPHAALDLGCGSGILALTAALLFPGLGRLVAADNDPEATETAAENAALNPTGPVLEVITGTLEAVPGDFDLMLANIRPSVLIPIAAELVARLRTSGHLILSGILNEEADAVAAPYLAAGLRELRRRSEGEWTALLFARGGAAA